MARSGRWIGSVRTSVRRTRVGRIIWRVIITIVGVLVIAVGIVLLPLPGPGWLVIFAGLGLLSTEYAWARRLLAWTKQKASDLANRARRRKKA
jgi:uncharacterized protein (TIGR02611 family)